MSLCGLCCPWHGGGGGLHGAREGREGSKVACSRLVAGSGGSPLIHTMEPP